MRDTSQKVTLQPWIMESYIPVIHPHHLIALNQAYFLTVPSSSRKTVRGPREIKNIIPDELNLHSFFIKTI